MRVVTANRELAQIKSFGLTLVKMKLPAVQIQREVVFRRKSANNPGLEDQVFNVRINFSGQKGDQAK
jgi:hypothetical protein